MSPRRTTNPSVACLVILAAIGAPAGAQTPGEPPPPATVRPVLADARRLVQEMKIGEAIALLEKRLDALPKDSPAERRALSVALADLYQQQGVDATEEFRWKEAITWCEKAYTLYAPYQPDEAGKILNAIGLVYLKTGESEKALGYFERALPLVRGAGDKEAEGDVLNNLGAYYRSRSDFQKALEYYNAALPVRRAARDRTGEATTLINLSAVHRFLADNTRALECLNQALGIFQELGDKSGQARTLLNLGQVYGDLSDSVRAVDALERALILARSAGDVAAEAATLTILGRTYANRSDYGKALDLYEQALPLVRKVGDRRTEAVLLNNMGTIYVALTDFARARAYYDQVLPLTRKLGDRQGEAATLNNIAQTYQYANKPDLALESFQQSLTIRREIGDLSGEATALNNIGTIYLIRGEYTEALKNFDAALTIQRKIGYRVGEMETLGNRGVLYSNRGEYAAARAECLLALTLARQIGDRNGEATTLRSLLFQHAKTENPARNPALAVWYGKQAVNVYQSIRQGIRQLPASVQKKYTDSVAETYRFLADQLIAEGRLPEAQQVLSLLKVEEVDGIVRRNDAVKEALEKLELSPEEKKVAERYAQIADRVTALGQEREGLERKRRQSGGAFTDPKDAARFKELEEELRVAAEAFKTFLDKELAVAFPPGAAGGKDFRVEAVQSSRALQSALTNLQEATGRKVAALYTLVGPDAYRVIVVTPFTRTAGSAPIKAADLNAKVAAFVAVLRDPRVDPRPLGKELYDLLIKPIENDLARAGTDTLMLSLDGTLRYLPLGALWDGKQYLIQKYRTSLFSPSVTTWLRDPAKGDAPVLALGVTRASAANGKSFAALPGTGDEVRAVAQRPTDRALLDDAFTRDALTGGIAGGFRLVHIASHFVFTPNGSSFLLLGANGVLPLSDISAGFFQDVDLLTLSACETAVGAGRNGTEVESFAAVAQEAGAKAVLATLWPVADTSTAVLMRDFYRRWSADKSLNKGEALRRAQLALLTGEVRGPTGSPTKGVEPQANATDLPSGLKPFPTDPKAPYAHPYYWAPFVLIGNFR